MCAIIGCIASLGGEQAQRTLETIFSRSVQRGRDGWGFETNENGLITDERHNSMFYPAYDDHFFHDTAGTGTLIGNMRAEPTTEHVKAKRPSDQQPYRVGSWSVVHNGTIANDAELRTHELSTKIDSAAIAELLEELSLANPNWPASNVFAHMIRRLKGSYAILAVNDDEAGLIYAACNYRPIWKAADETGVYFASSREYFPERLTPVMLPPYSIWLFRVDGGFRLDVVPATVPTRALVVCSGGLDSTVAARDAQACGAEVTLLHFAYGSRAEDREIEAVNAIAEALGCKLVILGLPIYDKSDSPLLRADSTIAGGEAGAEFAHEWVPARNLVMLSLATAFAEAKGFDTVVLGNNLEEAGAYPDNEPEFINHFNDLLPFAVGDGKRVRVVMPVGNLMKHEIVALGHELGAPLHLTWSCYRAGDQHCGTCGPCFMRRTAFDINGLPEVIDYANGGPQ
jgi:7-cyano-7-deazaguanine synthase